MQRVVGIADIALEFLEEGAVEIERLLWLGRGGQDFGIEFVDGSAVMGFGYVMCLCEPER